MSQTSETLSNVDQTQSLTPLSQLVGTLPDGYLEIPSPSTTTISKIDDDFEEDLGKRDKIVTETESESESESESENSTGSNPPPPDHPFDVNEAVFENSGMNAKQIDTEVGSMSTDNHFDEVGGLDSSLPTKHILKDATGMMSGGKTKPAGGKYPRARAKAREGDYVQGWTFDFRPLIILRRVNDTKHTMSRQIIDTRQINVPNNVKKKSTQGSGGGTEAACSGREVEGISGASSGHGPSEASLLTPETCENSAKSRIQVLFQRYLETQTQDVTVAQKHYSSHFSHGRLKSIMQVKSEQDAAIQALKYGPRRFQARPMPRHSNLLCRRPVTGNLEVPKDDETK